MKRDDINSLRKKKNAELKILKSLRRVTLCRVLLLLNKKITVYTARAAVAVRAAYTISG